LGDELPSQDLSHVLQQEDIYGVRVIGVAFDVRSIIDFCPTAIGWQMTIDMAIRPVVDARLGRLMGLIGVGRSSPGGRRP